MKKFGLMIIMIGAWGIVSMTGCVEEFEANIGIETVDGLVVEGDIISDSTVVFHLNKEMPLDVTENNKEVFDSYMDVMADLEVKGSDGTSWSGHRIGKGEYQVRIGTLKPEVEYHVEIRYDGNTYQSLPQKPLETVDIRNLTFKQADPEGPVTIMLDSEEGQADGSRYYLWHFVEDWEVHAEFVTNVLYSPVTDKIVSHEYPPVAQGWCHEAAEQLVLATTESNVGNRISGKLIHSIRNTDRRLSVLYSIRVFQRTLTRHEYEFYQERAKLNYEMGGLFTPQPSELPTNLTCNDPTRKVIGYVGCNLGVSQRQIYISTEDVNYVNHADCKHGGEPVGSNREKYMAGFQICDDSYIWAKGECVDVTWLNADPKGRPDWWPNDYLYGKE